MYEDEPTNPYEKFFDVMERPAAFEALEKTLLSQRPQTPVVTELDGRPLAHAPPARTAVRGRMGKDGEVMFSSVALRKGEPIVQYSGWIVSKGEFEALRRARYDRHEYPFPKYPLQQLNAVPIGDGRVVYARPLLFNNRNPLRNTAESTGSGAFARWGVTKMRRARKANAALVVRGAVVVLVAMRDIKPDEEVLVCVAPADYTSMVKELAWMHAYFEDGEGHVSNNPYHGAFGALASFVPATSSPRPEFALGPAEAMLLADASKIGANRLVEVIFDESALLMTEVAAHGALCARHAYRCRGEFSFDTISERIHVATSTGVSSTGYVPGDSPLDEVSGIIKASDAVQVIVKSHSFSDAVDRLLTLVDGMGKPIYGHIM